VEERWVLGISSRPLYTTKSVLSRGSMLKQNYFEEFWRCTKPRLKLNKIILAAKMIFIG